jgi:hypothetical protein
VTPDDEDRGFLTDGRPYLNARQAAIYCGFEPQARGAVVRTDRQMKSFFSWACSRGIRTEAGRAVYARAALDAAISQKSGAAQSAAVAAAGQQARDDVADARRRWRAQHRAAGVSR